MKSLLIFIFPFITSITMYAQSLILKVTGSENEPLVYASVYDALHKQHLLTQEDGTVQ